MNDPESQDRQDELALHAALDPDSLEPGELARSGAPGREQVAAWSRDLDRLRAVLRSEDQADDDSALVQRVLAATTREDLSWRGELRLVGSFLRSRWRSSMLVRVVAASLVLHVAALPLLGYLGLFEEREPGSFRSGIEPEVVLPPEPTEELPEIVAPAPEAELVDLARDDALALARFHLRAGAPRALPEDARSPLTLLLALRSRHLAGGAAGQGVDRPDGGPLELALAVEHGLDRLVLEGRAPEGLAHGLERLLGTGEGRPGSLLALAALARARSYGVAPPGTDAVLARLAAGVAGTDGGPLAERLLGAPLSRTGAPLDDAWLEALRLEAGPLLRADAAGRAWDEWSPSGR